jgi:hypothetical protein
MTSNRPRLQCVLVELSGQPAKKAFPPHIH